ncbi:hypothetical protein MFAL_28670 [Mycolicibacterium fallax]|nr:hypothetical protein MFAL_28670 [Mycolicibacterium fallax]
MSRTALRGDGAVVWQYAPSQPPPISPQNDSTDADASGAELNAVATVMAAAPKTLPICTLFNPLRAG